MDPTLSFIGPSESKDAHINSVIDCGWYVHGVSDRAGPVLLLKFVESPTREQLAPAAILCSLVLWSLSL